MNSASIRRVAVLALALGTTALAGCNTLNQPRNMSLYSVKQPVVERETFALDIATDYDGLPVSEQQRLSDWFASMNLRFGDRVSVADGSNSPLVRDDVAALAGRYGLLLADGAPVTEGDGQPGTVRVVITRSVASVPGCPDWSYNLEDRGYNQTSTNYGCASNGNLAAMVANPEDLVMGQQGTGETVVTTSTKAIRAYRAQEPTGTGGLPEVQTSEGDN